MRGTDGPARGGTEVPVTGTGPLLISLVSPYAWDSAKVSHKRVFALLTPENLQLAMAQMLQKTSVSRSRAVNR